jgi:aminoglycoside phosphotransferase (APT) family kinase protein
MESIAIHAVGGNRLTWPEVPEHVRAAIESRAGAPVVDASSRTGGFSPALASVLALADGRTAFAKAVSRTRNDFSAAAIVREAEILAAMPPEVPAPRFIGAYDDGEWVALVIEAIDGRTPAQPWRRDELDRFLAATTVLADTLTPSPIAAAPYADFVDEFTRWAAIDPGDVDDRFRHRLDELIRLEAGWAPSVDGDSLLHGDLRSDNFLLTADGFAVVDWPAVAVGAPWLDLLYALPSVTMHGGGDPDALWRASPLADAVDDDAVNAALAGVAGFFIGRSLEPPVPLLPTIREFQRVQGMVTLDWLGTRLGWG